MFGLLCSEQTNCWLFPRLSLSSFLSPLSYIVCKDMAKSGALFKRPLTAECQSVTCVISIVCVFFIYSLSMTSSSLP